MGERNRPGRPATSGVGPLLLGSYAVIAAVLVLIQAWPFITTVLHDLEIPFLDWGRLPTTVFYSACIWAGLSGIAVGDRRRLAGLRTAIALVVAAYAFSALAGATAIAWIDFAGRDVNFRLPGPFQGFVDRHPLNDTFSFGFLALLTPGAVIAALALGAAMVRWNSRQPLRIESLPSVLLVATTGCAAFLVGSAGAETLSYAISGEIDPADVAWPVLPVVALGAWCAWVTLAWRGVDAAPARASSSGAAVDTDKTLSSAARTSVLILVLLYIGISQTSVYARRMAELVEARQAFASDVLYAFFGKGGTLNTTTTSADGKLLKSSSPFIGVPWATDVEIIQYPGETTFVVEVTRKPSAEKQFAETWSVRQYHQSFDKGTATQQVADRYGIAHEAADDAVKLYPRIETQLRATDVSLPGAGISLDLTLFAFVVPLVVLATLVLFEYWLVRIIGSYHKGGELQWVLVDAQGGLVGVVALLWLVAILAGPWVLGVVFVEAVGLTLRTKGALNTLALEGAASLYVGAVLIMLAIATMSAARTLIALRRLARARRAAEAGETGA